MKVSMVSPFMACVANGGISPNCMAVRTGRPCNGRMIKRGAIFAKFLPGLKTMKIGILGNMNNMYFSMARYLAEEGYDCDLLLFDYEPAYFHPTADTFRQTLNFTVKQLTWGDYGRFFINPERIEKDLQPYTFLIGNGTAPAFVHKIGRRLDLFVPYGGDLYAFPFPRLVRPHKLLSNFVFAAAQRKGILQCPYILFDKASPHFEQVFRRLNYRGEQIVSPPPLFYYKEYEADLKKHETENPHFEQLEKLRAENDLLVLQHTRQFWKFHFDLWSRKGNDRLIKGYAAFRQRNPHTKSTLMLLEYGLDVTATKRLIASLGLEEHVVWFPKTLRKYLMMFIEASDVVVGELRYSWNTYCVVLEALSMGKPLLHKRTDADLAGAYPELYPMLHASSAAEVCSGLEEVANNKQKAVRMGAQGKEWFLRYCVQKPLEHIKSLLAEKGIHA